MTFVAGALLAAGGICFLARLVLGPSLADRVVALEGLVVAAVGGILVFSLVEGTEWYLDVALASSLIGFVGTVAAARYVETRGG
ncbi:MAG: hypothetical protein KatS3mg008_0163 [Acidimicrobiales bacterium]|nr:MAG: hypothetical protein KatS3mg008_0163 [Acidimicrobiales bacterium]